MKKTDFKTTSQEEQQFGVVASNIKITTTN
jgi:hypothetical protein